MFWFDSLSVFDILLFSTKISEFYRSDVSLLTQFSIWERRSSVWTVESFYGRLLLRIPKVCCLVGKESIIVSSFSNSLIFSSF
jgi:hypothetical protein